MSGQHEEAQIPVSSTSTSSAKEAPTFPDFYTDPNAVLGDTDAAWRFGKAPDYAKTRAFYADTKRSNHAPGSLEELAENLVKNWEIEASFKTRFSDWRTINQDRYTFAMNGGPNSEVEYMLKSGTYNAILGSNEYYCPKHNDFSLSHKTFKRMMPTFAWELLEVYSQPPKVAFRWRHWGYMKDDYTAFNQHGEKVKAKAHGNMLDIQGVTVADLDENFKIVHLETWFDSEGFFKQIAPNGVTKVPGKLTGSTMPGMEDDSAKRELGTHPEDPSPESVITNRSSGQASRSSLQHTRGSSTGQKSSHTGGTSHSGGCPFISANASRA